MTTPPTRSALRKRLLGQKARLLTNGPTYPYVLYPSNDGFNTEQFSVYGVIAATKLGADPTLVQQWSKWK
jgi:hypothetical protein